MAIGPGRVADAPPTTPELGPVPECAASKAEFRD